MQLSHSTKPNSQKKLSTYVQFSKSIKHWVIKQSGTHVRKIRMEQHWTFKFQTLDDMCVNYWSSVKVVKVMKGLASFNISISELILKYIFSVKMSVHLFTKEKVFKSASWNHLDFTLCSLIGLNTWIVSIFLLNLALVGFPWLFCFPKGDSVFTFDFFFYIIWCVLILFKHQAQKSYVWYCLIACIRKDLMGILFCVIHCTPGRGGWL